MLYAISGAQGCGKSTLLAALEAQGYNVVSRKTSRSILSDWNMTLDEINADPELSMKFQLEILNRKAQDEQEAIQSDEVWLTERTYMDLFVYTLINLGKHNEYSTWLDAYYDKCLENQQHYDGIFYVRSGLFDVSHDGVRGSNQHYSKLVDLTLEHYTVTSRSPLDIHTIDVASINRRVDFINRRIAMPGPNTLNARAQAICDATDRGEVELTQHESSEELFKSLGIRSDEQS